MKLEGVVTCVNYADFLAETLPINRPQFDRLVVVTTPEDVETQKLCEYWHVMCVQTDAFGPDGQLCKGAGINVGLHHLDMDGWVLQHDADIAFPPQMRQILERTPLDSMMLYGVDRFNMVGYEAWREHLKRPKLLHENSVYVHAGVYPVATRFMLPDGYMPIGYFQLWCPRGSGEFTYPATNTNAGKTDMQFAKRWPRERRGFLPELVVYHLESERAPQGANWNGRTTRPFESISRLGRFGHWWRRHRHRHHHHDPYFSS